MRVGSLFSGIGGLDLGLERAGMQISWQVEWDLKCQRILNQRWPDVPCYGDICGVDATMLEPVDLICGGFPCQPVSRIGRRRGTSDERWLWPEMARLVRELRPRYVLVENVPGLLTHGMGEVLGDLAVLGFDAEWESLPAVAFGAPHLRDRVFIVAWSQHRRPMAHASSRRGSENDVRPGRDASGGSGADVADAQGVGRVLDVQTNAIAEEGDTRLVFAGGGLRGGEGFRTRAWEVEPDVGRVAHGVPHQVDRLRMLGNGVVPQVIEWIGRRIMQVEGVPYPSDSAPREGG